MSPDELNRFVGNLRDDLEASGFQAPASRLAGVQGAAFTTGSEWLGALGTAVREIRAGSPFPPALDSKLERIMGEVRRVWPGM